MVLEGCWGAPTTAHSNGRGLGGLGTGFDHEAALRNFQAPQARPASKSINAGLTQLHSRQGSQQYSEHSQIAPTYTLQPSRQHTRSDSNPAGSMVPKSLAPHYAIPSSGSQQEPATAGHPAAQYDAFRTALSQHRPYGRARRGAIPVRATPAHL